MVECRHRFPLASIAVDAQFGRDVREVAALFLQRCADRQSRRTAHQITMRFHERAGRAIINFATTMPPADSDLAQQATRNPYLAAPRVYAVGRGTMLRMDPATLDNISKLGPIATALAAVVALIVGIVAVTQKSRADRRDQWWK